MFDWPASLVRDLIERLLPLYRSTDFAFAISGAMVTVAAALIMIAIVRHVLSANALRARAREISGYLVFGSASDATGADPSERQFNERFGEIDALMLKGGRFTDGVANAWRRYRRTLSHNMAPPIRATQQPSVYLYAAIAPPTWLGFAANLFIAFGLLATFLGLVAALTFATQGMVSSEAEVTQAAVRDLLAAASSKFVTSIAGVAISIVLRLVERLLTIDLRGHLDHLSNALEFGIRVDPGAHDAEIAELLQRVVQGGPTPPAAARAAPLAGARAP